jgi:hypothetical protein
MLLISLFYVVLPLTFLHGAIFGNHNVIVLNFNFSQRWPKSTNIGHVIPSSPTEILQCVGGAYFPNLQG